MQQARHPLAALMDRVRDLNGWTDPQLVDRATRAGETLSKSNISRIRNSDVVSLTGTTIKGLAAGLGIPAGEIARAALDSMGIKLADASNLDLETVIKTDATLSSNNREMLLGMVQQMRHLDAKRAHEDTSTQNPPSNPPTHGKARPRRTSMKVVKDEALTAAEQAESLDPAPIFDDHELAAARDEGELSKEKRRRLNERQDGV